MAISVLLVDDHSIFREGVFTLLKVTTDFNIVGEAGNGTDALLMAKRLHPDVVVLDCVMPLMNGTEVTRLLRHQKPAPHVVMLSMHNDMAYVQSAIQNGASGYILKEDIVAHLAQAIVAAASEQFYFSPSLRDKVDQSSMANFVGKTG